MSKKKKGFTLVEVIVVMLVATLVFSMVGGTMVYITVTTGNLIKQSEEIDMAKNIEKYVRNNIQTIIDNSPPPDTLNEETNEIVYIENISQLGQEGFSDIELVTFKIYQKNGESDFIRCNIEFKSGRQFDFIIGEVKE